MMRRATGWLGFTAKRLRRQFVSPVSTSMLVTLSLNDTSKTFSSNKDMVNYLTETSLVSDPLVKEFFDQHDRLSFLPENSKLYTLGPTKLSDQVSVTSVLMQGITLDVIAAVLRSISSTEGVKLLDVGCATGVLSFGAAFLVEKIFQVVKNNLENR